MILSWLVAKAKQIAARERLRVTMEQMSESELKDIGLVRGDIDGVVKGVKFPTARPPHPPLILQPLRTTYKGDGK